MRAEAFKSEFLSRLHKLQDNPYAYGNLTVRSLLDLREHCLAEFDFHDPYLKQKRKENEQAVELFPARLQHLSQLNWEKRLVQVHIFFSNKRYITTNSIDWRHFSWPLDSSPEMCLTGEQRRWHFWWRKGSWLVKYTHYDEHGTDTMGRYQDPRAYMGHLISNF